MRMTKMMIAGGLVLTLGAFSPVLAQSPKNSTSQNTSYSDTSNTNPSQASNPTDQNQDQDQNSATNDQSSDQANAQQNENSENQQNQTSSNQQSEASATASSLNQQQDRIERQIRHLDRDLSDAESYEAKAREAWNDNNTSEAQRNFRTAEQILKMATGGGNYQAAMLGENPQHEQWMTEKAIKHAKASGVDVSDAEHYYQDGKDALNKGDKAEASRDFRAAQLAAGVPVEVGYAEVWEAKIPAGERENQMASAQEGNESGAWAQPNSQSAMNSSTDQKQMDDAQTFLRHGQEALKNGDKSQAQRDFRAAERALSMNETSNSYSGSSQNNNSTSSQ